MLVAELQPDTVRRLLDNVTKAAQRLSLNFFLLQPMRLIRVKVLSHCSIGASETLKTPKDQIAVSGCSFCFELLEGCQEQTRIEGGSARRNGTHGLPLHEIHLHGWFYGDNLLVMTLKGRRDTARERFRVSGSFPSRVKIPGPSETMDGLLGPRLPSFAKSLGRAGIGSMGRGCG